ncbi:MAG: hypothetical protein K8T91_06740 [Planctomycetes bacterium]|nr:hypothetical protein [Planctomycetota bacterium]
MVEDSLPLARHVYDQVTLAEEPDSEGRWEITVADGFENDAATFTDKQLAKAGYRLAELLKAIYPDTD